jgi:3-hydroxyisobutyrate dehydrogenase-like beta-hydroxyacid dehydrogenase
MKMRGPDILRLLTGGQAAAAQFSVAGAKKDLITAVGYAATLGVELPVAARAAAMFADAEAAGLGESDAISTIPVHWALRKSKRCP